MFDWKDFLTLGERLCGVGDDATFPAEASYRSAVSRSYYAAWHAAEDLLVKKNEYKPDKTGTDHMGVIRAYTDSPSPTRKQIGAWLDRLRQRRRRADYDDTLVQSAEMAKQATNDAKRILSYLASQ